MKKVSPLAVAMIVVSSAGTAYAKEAAPPPTPEFRVLQKAALSYLGSRKPMTIDTPHLKDAIADPAKAPFLLDVRRPEDHAKGAVPGTKANIFWDKLPTADLSALPKARPIVAYCYTGNTSQSAAAILGLLGYDVRSLDYSMMAWTKNPEVQLPKHNWDPAAGNAFGIEKEARTLTATYPFPEIKTGGKDLREIVLRAAADSVARVKVSTILAADVAKKLNDDPANRPVIVDLRSPKDYARGHVPGAVNVQIEDVARPRTLARLPPGRQVVVYDYAGTRSQVVAMTLRILGYDAASMKFGIMDWSRDDALLGAVTRWSPATGQWDLEVDGK